MRLVFLGPPGSGKGTQTEYLKRYFGIARISTGDILRNSIESGDYFNLKETIKSGELISDEVIITLVRDRLKQKDCKKGYLLDGFPRNIPQANALKNASIKLDYVIQLDISEKDLIERISGRRIHQASGRTYHIRFNPPKIAGKDDITGEPIIQRNDDSESIIQNRLKVYFRETWPLIGYYSRCIKKEPSTSPKFLKVSGIGTVKSVNLRILKAIGNKNPSF